MAVTAVAAGGWWVTHPHRLGELGSETGVPVRVGETALIGVFAYPSSGSVRLHHARPRVRDGSAAADMRVLFCVGPAGGSPIGALRERPEEVCAETPALSGQELAMPSADNRFGHLVLEIVPREPGEVVVDGLDITYSAGLQRGSQRSGVVARVQAAAG